MTEYPAHERSATIKITSHSYLARLLVSRKMDNAISTDHLTKTLSIYLPKKVKVTEGELVSLAHILHEDARQTLMRWMQASFASGKTASYGMRSFMHYYDLDDDDLNQETTLRQWQRWVRKHTDLLQKPKEMIISPPVRVWDENRFANFIADIVEYLYSSTGKWSDKRLAALRLTAYNSSVTVTKKINTLGYKDNTAYVAIANTKRWISSHKDVAKAWEKYYGAMV